MGQVSRAIGRIFVSMLLAMFLFTFLLLYSFSGEINKENVSDIATGIIQEPLENAFYSQFNNGQGINFEEAYNDLVLQCEIQDSINLVNDVVIDCTELENIGPEGIEALLEKKFRDQINKVVSQEIENRQIMKYLNFIEISMWIMGIFCLIMIFLLFILSVHKYKFFVDFGVVGIIVGFPHLIFKNISLPFDSYVNSFIEVILDNMYFNFFIVFVLGIASFLLGMILRAIVKKPKQIEKEVKKPKESKKKEVKDQKNKSKK